MAGIRGGFSGGVQRGVHPLKFSSTTQKSSKTECTLYVNIIIELIASKFQLKGQV